MTRFSLGRARVKNTATLAVIVSLALAGCSSDKILDVDLVDEVDPTAVRSAAGADAVRIGALARLNAATTGAESLFLLSGLFSDEFNNGDSFIARMTRPDVAQFSTKT